MATVRSCSSARMLTFIAMVMMVRLCAALPVSTPAPSPLSSYLAPNNIKCLGCPPDHHVTMHCDVDGGRSACAPCPPGTSSLGCNSATSCVADTPPLNAGKDWMPGEIVGIVAAVAWVVSIVVCCYCYKNNKSFRRCQEAITYRGLLNRSHT